MIRTISILAFLLCAATGHCQQFDSSNESDSVLRKLPSLQRLLDSAMLHSPLLVQQGCQISIRELQLERKRLQWLEYFNVETFVQYGNNNSYVSNSFSTGGNTGNTSSSQTRYGVGFTVKYPIFNLFSQRKDVAIAKQEIASANLQRKIYEQDVRKSIIELYNRVLLSNSLLRAKLEALQMSRLAVDQSERDFKMSKITINELSKISDSNMKNITEYQLALSDLRLSLDLLQELSGYYFLKR